MSLKEKTFSAGRWTATSGLVRMALQVVQTAILARLLVPADFGSMAIIGALLAVVSLFADLGLSRAIIYFPAITRDVLSSLFWLNLGIGFVLTVLFAMLSPAIAAIYHQTSLTSALVAASPIFVLSAFGQQFCILAEKDLRFAILARNEMLAAINGFLAALVLAILGGGIYALIGGSLLAAVTNSVLAWFTLSQAHRPRFHLRIGEALPLLRYGGYLVAENLANTLVRQADVLVGGAMASTAALGVYSMPRDLSLRVATVVNPILARVGFPVMARLQGDPVALRMIYLQTLRMTASANFPAYVVLGLFAPEIVAILYGPKWHGATIFLRIFAAWGLVRSVGSLVGNLLYAIGRVRLALGWNLILLVAFFPLLWAGTHIGGLEGLAWTMLGLQLAVFLPSWRYLVSPACGARLGEFAGAILPPFIVALVSGVVAWLAVIAIDRPFMRLLIGGCTGLVVYLALSLRFNRSWTDSMKTLLKWDYPSRTRPTS